MYESEEAPREPMPGACDWPKKQQSLVSCWALVGGKAAKKQECGELTWLRSREEARLGP